MFPKKDLKIRAREFRALRYGENPHQKGVFYKDSHCSDRLSLFNFKQLQGKEISFNNLLDVDGALYCLSQLGGRKPASVAIKHTNPCGAAYGGSIFESFRKTWHGDLIAVFGGVIGVNRKVDGRLAKLMLFLSKNKFFEVLLAPSLTKEALRLFSQRKNLRVLVNSALTDPRPSKECDYKRVRGGWLAQEVDTCQITERDLKVVTKKVPVPSAIKDLLFAWKICKSSKSNAVVIVRKEMLIGTGVGQQDRKECCKLAVGKCQDPARGRNKKSTEGAAAASDAFFPFSDGPEILARAGIRAIIQPGGSLRDQETIDLCNKYHIAMVFTGTRCFRH